MATTATKTVRKQAPAAPLDETGLEAWRTFITVNSRLMRELDDELREEHGYTLGDYDVLVQLSLAPSERLRMCDLANAVLLSPSGLSRRVERLERSGFVQRDRASSDGRSIEARLTTSGKRLVRRLGRAHLAGVKERFADQFSNTELGTIRDLLGRLDTADCS